MDKPKRVFLKKLPLKEITEMLNMLYSDGIEYIDLIGVSYGDGKQDEVFIAVPQEYMKPLPENSATIIEEPKEEDVKENVPKTIEKNNINDLLDRSL